VCDWYDQSHWFLIIQLLISPSEATANQMMHKIVFLFRTISSGWCFSSLKLGSKWKAGKIVVLYNALSHASPAPLPPLLGWHRPCRFALPVLGRGNRSFVFRPINVLPFSASQPFVMVNRAFLCVLPPNSEHAHTLSSFSMSTQFYGHGQGMLSS
jgi:hypothetical protein